VSPAKEIATSVRGRATIFGPQSQAQPNLRRRSVAMTSSRVLPTTLIQAKSKRLVRSGENPLDEVRVSKDAAHCGTSISVQEGINGHFRAGKEVAAFGRRKAWNRRRDDKYYGCPRALREQLLRQLFMASARQTVDCQIRPTRHFIGLV
jgi:hypothetical protein